MSNFPSGASGAGLLVIRLTLAFAGIALGVERLVFAASTPLVGYVVAVGLSGVVSIVGSVFLAIGLLTSRLMTSLAIVELVMLFVRLSAGPAHGSAPTLLGGSLYAAIAVGLALTGPGAFSVDARRYGRHEIVLPPRPNAAHDAPASHH